MAARSTAEEAFLKELEEKLTEFSQFLQEHWGADESLELLLLIGLGVFLGAFNTHQVCQVLGLEESGTYEEIGKVSVYHWHKLLQQTLYDWVIPLLQERQEKSAATHSRDGWVLAVDDTLIARLATALGYVWQWWSGHAKQVTEGQNVIALIVVVGELVLPLDVRIVSKQGQNIRTKPQIFAEMRDEFSAGSYIISPILPNHLQREPVVLQGYVIRHGVVGVVDVAAAFHGHRELVADLGFDGLFRAGQNAHVDVAEEHQAVTV